MPSAAAIQQYLLGAWRLMFGRADGMRLLDTSVDGFWDSFWAIAFAFPALALGWAAFASDMPADVYGSRPSIILRLLVTDLAEWLVPIAGLAVVARPLGIADRFVHYVVASNWATALVVWLTLPLPLLRFAMPGGGELLTAISLCVFIATLVLSWRLTNASLNKGPGVATAVMAGVLAFSIFLSLWLETALGLYVAPAG